MVWKAQIGSTFLVESGPVEHLHFVLNDPLDFDGYPRGSCIVVNVSTPHERSDNTCILKAGTHKFITHDSFVFYRKARVRQASELEKLVAARTYRPHDPVSIQFIQNIVSFMHDCIQVDDEMKIFARKVESQLCQKRQITPVLRLAASAGTKIL